MQHTFHNTIDLKGTDLSNAIKRAKNQEEVILIFYKDRQKYTAGDIHNKLIENGFRHPLTSTRRGISNLFNKGEVVKLSEMKLGEYNVPEHFYQLNFLKYPSKVAEQSKLF